MYVYYLLYHKKILSAEDVQCTSCKLPRDEFCALAKKWARSIERERRKFQKRTEFSLWKNVHQGFFIKGPGRITVYFELKIILFFKRNICIFASKIKPVIFLQIFEFSRQILSYKLKQIWYENLNYEEFSG